MSGITVPANNFFLATVRMSQPKAISLISKSIIQQIMPALFPDERWDTGQIPEGSALACLPVNLEMLSTHTA